MTQGSGKRAYRNPLAGHQDQILFFFLFILGSAGIWFAKTEFSDPFLATAFPLVLMTLYAVVALATKRYRLREDRVGDNVYYLGFLFTLVSLSHALYKFSSGDPANIITNFGIAIFTTIWGLAGRVLFNQMREDPVEYEREARQTLADAVRELRTQLGDVSMEMSLSKRKLVQVMEEGVTEVANSAKNAMSENVAAFSKAVTEVLTAFKQATSNFTDQSTTLATAMGASSAAAEALRNATVQSNELLAKNLAEFSTNMDQNLAKATQVLDNLSGTAKALARAVEDSSHARRAEVGDGKGLRSWIFGLLRRGT